MIDKTSLFKLEDIDAGVIRTTLTEVHDALEERGYNATNQIVGYLISGDPGYISSHKEARSKIVKFDRTKILEIVIRKYLQK